VPPLPTNCPAVDPRPEVEEELPEAEEEEFEDPAVPEVLPLPLVVEPEVVGPRETREVADRNAAEPPPVCKPFVEVTDVEAEAEEPDESVPPVELELLVED